MKKFQVVYRAKYILSVMTEVIECAAMPDNKQLKKILNDLIVKNNIKVEGDYLKITKIISVAETK